MVERRRPSKSGDVRRPYRQSRACPVNPWRRATRRRASGCRSVSRRRGSTGPWTCHHASRNSESPSVSSRVAGLSVGETTLGEFFAHVVDVEAEFAVRQTLTFFLFDGFSSASGGENFVGVLA